MRCQLHAVVLSEKSDGLLIVSASTAPIRPAGCVPLTPNAGRVPVPPGRVSHARVIQPVGEPYFPGVPRSMYSCASKWLRVTVVAMPQACTMASLPSFHRSRRPPAEGCSPKPVSAPFANSSGNAP